MASKLSGSPMPPTTRNPGLQNLRLDQNGLPIHGVLYFSPAWTLSSVEADAHSVRAVSRLEFWRQPDMMAQFPFAHIITMTHRLAGGVSTVTDLVRDPDGRAVFGVPGRSALPSGRSIRWEWPTHRPDATPCAWSR
jgi:hypothetical protein